MEQALLERINSKKIVAEAYNLAEMAHRGQQRKNDGVTPYITHPAAVAIMLASYGADDETIAAGYLHDVVEDTNVTLEEIREKFGEKIAFLVDGVTKPKEDSAKKTFLKIADYAAKDKRVLLIKLADRIHNIETKLDSAEWQNKYYNSTKEFLIPMAKAAGFFDMARKLEELLLTLKQNGT